LGSVCWVRMADGWDSPNSATIIWGDRVFFKPAGNIGDGLWLRFATDIDHHRLIDPENRSIWVGLCWSLWGDDTELGSQLQG
jgi:hypothetical protein